MSMVPTAEDMASWPPLNYENPETRRPLVLGIEIPLCVLVIAFTSMRFYSRTIIIRALGADDWFMLVAAITAVATSIATCISTDRTIQTGYHVWDLDLAILQNLVVTGQIGMATQLLFVIITGLAKVSVLRTYLRIFPSNTNTNFCYTLLAFTTAWAITSFCLYLFQCKPVQSYWLRYQYPNRECLGIAPIYYSTGCLNILSDFLIFLWPAKGIWKFRIPYKQRVTLIAMFTLGVVVCIAGICCLWYTSIYANSYDAHLKDEVTTREGVVSVPGFEWWWWNTEGGGV
ncbi:hypothetical protein CC78DRAFT_542861 [Lojkania enalia]|uniref:Rhodopsin domain-containing protein n=1 Tax=Lojkania enalia TaxID=147567 RepID=A0A9P4KCX4_9PLEO|nr:hypothetical protein CC78DRAFT_542861 [Didymosphaeria enalia]